MMRFLCLIKFVWFLLIVESICWKCFVSMMNYSWRRFFFCLLNVDWMCWWFFILFFGMRVIIRDKCILYWICWNFKVFKGYVVILVLVFLINWCLFKEFGVCIEWDIICYVIWLFGLGCSGFLNCCEMSLVLIFWDVILIIWNNFCYWVEILVFFGLNVWLFEFVFVLILKFWVIG